jgi:hypothetical protein
MDGRLGSFIRGDGVRSRLEVGDTSNNMFGVATILETAAIRCAIASRSSWKSRWAGNSNANEPDPELDPCETADEICGVRMPGSSADCRKVRSCWMVLGEEDATRPQNKRWVTNRQPGSGATRDRDRLGAHLSSSATVLPTRFAGPSSLLRSRMLLAGEESKRQSIGTFAAWNVCHRFRRMCWCVNGVLASDFKTQSL